MIYSQVSYEFGDPKISSFVIYERVHDDRIRHMMRHQMTINIQYRDTSGHTDENKMDKMTLDF